LGCIEDWIAISQSIGARSGVVFVRRKSAGGRIFHFGNYGADDRGVHFVLVELVSGLIPSDTMRQTQTALGIKHNRRIKIQPLTTNYLRCILAE
jgi:hypothetical protein